MKKKIITYDGKTLERIDNYDVFFCRSEHKYYQVLPTGLREIAGVSRILEETGLKTVNNYMRRMKYYMDRGSRLHRACFLDDLGQLDEKIVADDIKGRLEAYRRWRYDWSPIIIEHEKPCYSPSLDLCGIFDILVSLPHSQHPRRKDIIDIKSGGHENWHEYQLTAYTILMFGAEWLRHGSWELYLKDNGRYNFNEIPLNEQISAGSELVKRIQNYRERKFSLGGD